MLVFDVMRTMIGHGQRFGEALGFIINGAGPNGVHVAGVGLRLRVDFRVAVDLAGGSQQEAGLVRARNAETVMGSQRARFHGLDGQVEITGFGLRIWAGG